VFRTSSPVMTGNIPGTIDLEISDPVLMLNEIARRYETTERVIMEYVDNALDDAEILYRENDHHYPYPVKIELTIDFPASRIVIKDNCRGMPRQLLERVVKNIGESQKRGVTWVNGRFGFGVQAFRAAAQYIQFQTKHSTGSTFTLALQRDQHRGIKEAKRADTPFPSDSGTGTIVTITGIDPAWSDFSIESIKAEIESHFERLVARPGLSITVGAAGETPLRCKPFDYRQVAGESIQQTLYVPHKDETYPIEVYLLAAQEGQPRRPVTFFVRGRRINEAVGIKSFIRKSKYKTSLWGHSHLLGYVEVGEIVQPAITRDDFNRTRGRQLCYETILALEPEIKAMISRVNKSNKGKMLAGLESVVTAAISNVATAPVQDVAPPATYDPGHTTTPAAPTNLSANITPPAAPAPEPPSSPQPGPPQPVAQPVVAEPAQPPPPGPPVEQPVIQFTGSLPDAQMATRRAFLTDGAIHINTNHPDFKARMAFTRQGTPKITDRLIAYLAGVITAYLPASQSPATIPPTPKTIRFVKRKSTQCSNLRRFCTNNAPGLNGN
jgi:hypothetical protein